jgi:hypothetical protein
MSLFTCRLFFGFFCGRGLMAMSSCPGAVRQDYCDGRVRKCLVRLASDATAHRAPGYEVDVADGACTNVACRPLGNGEGKGQTTLKRGRSQLSCCCCIQVHM